MLTILLVIASIFVFMEDAKLVYFLDPATILMLMIPTVVILWAAGLGKAFLLPFRIHNKKEASFEEMENGRKALKLASDSLLVLGALESVTTIVLLFVMENTLPVGVLYPNIGVSLLSLVYALIFYLLLLPIRSRME